MDGDRDGDEWRSWRWSWRLRGRGRGGISISYIGIFSRLKLITDSACVVHIILQSKIYHSPPLILISALPIRLWLILELSSFPCPQNSSCHRSDEYESSGFSRPLQYQGGGSPNTDHKRCYRCNCESKNGGTLWEASSQMFKKSSNRCR